MSGPTLHEVLAAQGWTHEPGRSGRRVVRDAAGAKLFTGRAQEVWHWLRERGVLPAEAA